MCVVKPATDSQCMLCTLSHDQVNFTFIDINTLAQQVECTTNKSCRHHPSSLSTWALLLQKLPGTSQESCCYHPSSMSTWALLFCRSCRAKLQEHNDRRRKRPTAQQACQDVLEHSRPRRTRRTALPASPHLENETLAIRPQRVPRRLKTGPFAHLLPEEKATSTSSGVSVTACCVKHPRAPAAAAHSN